MAGERQCLDRSPNGSNGIANALHFGPRFAFEVKAHAEQLCISQARKEERCFVSRIHGLHVGTSGKSYASRGKENVRLQVWLVRKS
jgi:hypothetical protein